MGKYVKAAFLAKPTVPLVGPLPLNAVAFVALMILGFGNPGFWLLALGLETAYLFTLSTNKRFQKVVDSAKYSQLNKTQERKRLILISELRNEDRIKLRRLEDKAARITAMYRNLQADDIVAKTNSDMLQSLTWAYLKLLLARHTISTQWGESSEEGIKREVAKIERELKDGELTSSLKESKTDTLRVLLRRLDNQKRRRQRIEEIESNLSRIEAQFDLALENAAISSTPQTLQPGLDMVGDSLDDEFFGTFGTTVREIDSSIHERISGHEKTTEKA